MKRLNGLWWCIGMLILIGGIISCEKSDRDLTSPETSGLETTVSETTEGELSQSQWPTCSPPSGWSTVDIDAGNSVVASGSIDWYQGQVGWTRWQYPVCVHNYARLLVGWPVCAWDLDYFYYFTDSYFTDPSHMTDTRVRRYGDPGYQGPNTPAGVYIDATASNPCGITGRYLRVTIGTSNPAGTYYVVAP